MIETSILTSLYRCEEYLEHFFESILCFENLTEIEFVLIHNDPTDNEQEIVTTFLRNNPTINSQYVVVPRESIYASWNRGIIVSKGDFITIWNVDDIRIPNALKLQIHVLQINKDIDMVYGNRYTITRFGDKNKKLEITRDINQSCWNNFFQDGAFLMWRKTVHETIGYFDEQFKIGGDAEFWQRLTESRKVFKIEVPIGIYVREKGKGISKRSKDGYYEAIVLGLRYGFYPRMVIDPLGWLKALKMFNARQIHYLGKIQKRTILKYHSPVVYLISLFYLICLAVPFYILSNVLDLNQYNYHYFKRQFNSLTNKNTQEII